MLLSYCYSYRDSPTMKAIDDSTLLYGVVLCVNILVLFVLPVGKCSCCPTVPVSGSQWPGHCG